MVHSSLQAMVARDVRPSEPELAQPEEEEVEKVREGEVGGDLNGE